LEGSFSITFSLSDDVIADSCSDEDGGEKTRLIEYVGETTTKEFVRVTIARHSIRFSTILLELNSGILGNNCDGDFGNVDKAVGFMIKESHY